MDNNDQVAGTTESFVEGPESLESITFSNKRSPQKPSSEITLFPELFDIGETLFKRNISPWKQRFKWDCGIACVAMCISPHDRQDLYMNIDVRKESYNFNDSTWTIDLCYVLKHYGVTFHFATRFAGVDPKFRKYAYYKRFLDQDTERVMNGFEHAAENSISVSVTKLYIQDIFQHIYRKGPAIVLVNGNLLRCLDCSSKFATMYTCCFRSCYQGHFVLAIGFDLKKNCIYYNNPTYGDRTCRMSFGEFEQARTAYGTDWDSILIESSSSSSQSVTSV